MHLLKIQVAIWKQESTQKTEDTEYDCAKTMYNVHISEMNLVNDKFDHS